MINFGNGVLLCLCSHAVVYVALFPVMVLGSTSLVGGTFVRPYHFPCVVTLGSAQYESTKEVCKSK